MPEVLTNTWARQVMAEHRELRADVARLREFLNAPRPAASRAGAHSWAAELSSRLSALHDKLFRHFRLEEEGGMVEEVSTAHPRAAGEITRIVADHPRMLQETRELVGLTLDYSAARTPIDVPLRRRVTALLDWLEEHERDETDLIQRVEYRDTAAAD
ncbi:MAG: hemerythrin domain-containing protein [Acidobacteriota bacterium]|nr:hemerythrin domain-containing protein [Acidobacteriota bacterium]MDH3522656.1 hemerythrin domain-containing protein [Acidobacteriota bacterium]